MFKKINEWATLPQHQTPHSAGADLHLNNATELVLYPKSMAMIGTGLTITIPDNHYGAIYIRSSAAKKGLMLANSVGVIDSDYKDEIKLLLYNYTDYPITLQPHERVAQMIVQPYIRCAEVLNQERSGGFGSTNN